MKRNNSQHSGLTQRSDYLANSSEAETLKSCATKASNGSTSSLNGVKSNDIEALTHRSQRHENVKKNYDSNYVKLSHLIQEAFIEIKHKTMKNNPSCLSAFKKSTLFENNDEVVHHTDPIILFQYIKQLYDKNLESKNKTEKEAESDKEDGSVVNDYESMLQKLEAEVRQHIRIEQQLKLYVESTQAKLDDFEKNADSSQTEDLKKELEGIKHDNHVLSEKLKKRSIEIDNYSKELSHKSDIIKKLEQQLETVPTLKNKIREMETLLNQGGSSTLRNYNRNSKDSESFSKITNVSNNHITNEGKSRKNSQPFLGVHLQEGIKKRGVEKDKNKENSEVLKMELAKFNGDIPKLHFESYRLNSDSNVEKTAIASKYENYGAKTSRRVEKADEVRSSSKARKSQRSESNSNSNLYKDKVQQSGNDFYSEDKLTNLRMLGSAVNSDMIEKSKFGFDRLSVQSTNQDRSHKKMLQKRRDSKSRNDYKDTSETVNMSTSRCKLPKSSRPSTGNERQSYCPDSSRIKKESENYDISKLKMSSPQKDSQDRSQSVDAKTRFYRELKSREERCDKILEEKRRRSAYNIQNKHHNTFNNSHKLSGIF